MEKQKTVADILGEVIQDMCDKYCKYPEEYVQKYGADDERMYGEVCDKCPLNKLV